MMVAWLVAVIGVGLAAVAEARLVTFEFAGDVSAGQVIRLDFTPTATTSLCPYDPGAWMADVQVFVDAPFDVTVDVDRLPQTVPLWNAIGAFVPSPGAFHYASITASPHPPTLTGIQRIAWSWAVWSFSNPSPAAWCHPAQCLFAPAVCACEVDLTTYTGGSGAGVASIAHGWSVPQGVCMTRMVGQFSCHGNVPCDLPHLSLVPAP